MMLCPSCQNSFYGCPGCQECDGNGYISSAEEVTLHVPFNLAGEPMYRRPNGKNVLVTFLCIYGVIIFIGSCVALYLEAR